MRLSQDSTRRQTMQIPHNSNRGKTKQAVSSRYASGALRSLILVATIPDRRLSTTTTSLAYIRFIFPSPSSLVYAPEPCPLKIVEHGQNDLIFGSLLATNAVDDVGGSFKSVRRTPKRFCYVIANMSHQTCASMNVANLEPVVIHEFILEAPSMAL